MPIRHFRKHIESDTERSSSSSDEEVVERKVTKPVKHIDEEKIEAANSSQSDSGDSDMESESESSSDEEVQLHKPIFLKKRKLMPSDKVKVDRDNDRLKRIEEENKRLKTQEQVQKQLDNNYSTDKELLRKILALNDDDTVNPEYEKEQWVIRQEERRHRYREKLLAKQLELEEKELRKLQSTNGTFIEAKTEPGEGNKDSKQMPKNKFHKQSIYKPGKLGTIAFDKSTDSADIQEANEYSVL